MHLPETNSPSGFPIWPFYLLYDEMFLLKNWLMYLYPNKMLQEDQSVYNYRNSCPRRGIENTFDILVASWSIFNTPINASVEIVEKYVKAAVVLHNYLR